MAQLNRKSMHYSLSDEVVSVSIPAKSKMEEENFNYDLERMKQQVNGKSVEIPDCQNFEEFDKWIMSA